MSRVYSGRLHCLGSVLDRTMQLPSRGDRYAGRRMSEVRYDVHLTEPPAIDEL